MKMCHSEELCRKRLLQKIPRCREEVGWGGGLERWRVPLDFPVRRRWRKNCMRGGVVLYSNEISTLDTCVKLVWHYLIYVFQRRIESKKRHTHLQTVGPRPSSANSMRKWQEKTSRTNVHVTRSCESGGRVTWQEKPGKSKTRDASLVSSLRQFTQQWSSSTKGGGARMREYRKPSSEESKHDFPLCYDAAKDTWWAKRKEAWGRESRIERLYDKREKEQGQQARWLFVGSSRPHHCTRGPKNKSMVKKSGSVKAYVEFAMLI